MSFAAEEAGYNNGQLDTNAKLDDLYDYIEGLRIRLEEEMQR